MGPFFEAQASDGANVWVIIRGELHSEEAGRNPVLKQLPLRLRAAAYALRGGFLIRPLVIAVTLGLWRNAGAFPVERSDANTWSSRARSLAC
jgi:hypothetical protein